MGEIADLLDQAMWEMYQSLIEEGASPEEAHKRVRAVDWSRYNLFADDQAELALWEEIEEAERRETEGAADAYPGKRPSQETEEYWIHTQAPAKHRQKHMERCGKWLVFVDTENLDTAWATIRVATEKGLLGIAAKAATARPNPLARDPHTKVICVYTSDGEDRADVARVLRGLRAIGITHRPLYWKSDQDTLAGRYSRGGQRVSRWSCQDFEAPGHGETLSATALRSRRGPAA
jgi:hypothetical protein